MKTLTLTLEADHQRPERKTWIVTETGDREEKIKELFGTNRLPTAFCDPMTAEEVRRRIEALNPDANVIVKINENCCICNTKGVDDIWYFCDTCREKAEIEQQLGHHDDI